MAQVQLVVVQPAVDEEKQVPCTAVLPINLLNEYSFSKLGSQRSLSISHKESSQTVGSVAIATFPSAVHPPTSEELATLRHVGDKIPLSAWLVALIALSERFTYYGLTAPFRKCHTHNNPRNDPLRPGALGLGQSTATRFSYLLTFLVYATSFGGAVVADGWLGRYKSLALFASIYVVGALILFITSLPVSLDHGGGFGGLVAAVIVIGIGAGGMKSNLAPFMADQCTDDSPGGMRVITTAKGERVIIDQAVTLQKIYTIFYWCVNVGSLSGVATTLIEKYVGFWAAFLLPFCSLWVALAVLILGRTRFIKSPAQGTILPQALKAFWLGIRGGFKMDAALPAAQASKHQRTVGWDATFIHELKRGLLACRVFLAWPILLLCQSQMSTNLVSQAATMETHGLPNDVISFLNPISVIILLPLADRLLYPALRRAKIAFSPIARMALGFFLEACAQAYASGLQHIVYSAPPCYSAPLKCSSNPGPNHVNVFAQTPIYFLEGLGEVFSSPGAYEYAYAAAPPRMKSLLQAVLVGMGALAVLLGLAVSPLYRDPLLVAAYAVLAGMMLATTVVYSVAFRDVAADTDAPVEEEVSDPAPEQSNTNLAPESA
ncbi:MFS peptide transporter [Mycena pura]|uniref:MFS peptide transporter n=1 Tax=Mycena pura TaxID=153505 RepID=A0AAD6VL86_9AGAR|nr:MFS peptide transporter [Mycena pura]